MKDWRVSVAKEWTAVVVSGTREEHSGLPGVKSGGLEGISGKDGTSRGGERGGEHSVLPGVKSELLRGISGQKVVRGGLVRGGKLVLSPSRGEKWWVEG